MGINSKDKTDFYYKLSKKHGYRARSVYKLIQIDEEFKILKNKKRVVDLCGAPGGWAQLVAQKKIEFILVVDLQDMEPLEGVITLKEDITTDVAVNKIKFRLQPSLAELVLFDGAPDVTGIHSLDEYLQIQLLLNALKITLKIGEKGSQFVGKIFRGEYAKYVVFHFKKFYKEVQLVKPKASRSTSIECFILCNDLYNTIETTFSTKEIIEEVEVVSCGKEQIEYNLVHSGGIQPKTNPINPPYSKAIISRKNN